MTSKLVTICALFFVIATVAYFSVVVRQFGFLQPATYRLVVLSVRCAALLPLCSLFMFISLLAPSSFVVMVVLVTVVEGYCLYCFLALLVENLGGPFALVEHMNKAKKSLALCVSIFPAEPFRFYQVCTGALFSILVLRPVLSVLAMICFYAGTAAGSAFYVLFNIISAGILIYGMVCIVNLYENVYENCVNLFGVLKLTLIKVSVGAIVVQGLIENILYSSGSVGFSDDDTYSGEQKALRAYCALVLTELALLSVVYYYAYGDHKITPSSAPAAVRSFLSDKHSPYRASTSGVRAVETLVYSFPSFVRDVCCVQDVLVPGYFYAGGAEHDLSEPLNTGSGDAGDAEAGATTSALHTGSPLAGLFGIVSPVRSAAVWSPDRTKGPAAAHTAHKKQTQRYSPVPSSSDPAQEGDELSPYVGMSDIYGNSPNNKSPMGHGLNFDRPAPAGHSARPPALQTQPQTQAQSPMQNKPNLQPNSPFVDYSAVYGDDQVSDSFEV